MGIDSNSDELDSDSSNKDGLLESDLSCSTILKGIHINNHLFQLIAINRRHL